VQLGKAGAAVTGVFLSWWLVGNFCGSGANFSGERKTMYSPLPQRAERTAFQTAGALVSLRRKFVRSN
jgi:hypothetical protein